MRSTLNEKPSSVGPVKRTVYDGQSDDLLTGGLGWDGLSGSSPPGVSARPTASELRRLAIYTNYRALVDTSEGGGYGRLFGPNISPLGDVDESPGAGKVPGVEYLAFCMDDAGRATATMMVQVPALFDPGKPAIIVVPSPGSRGVYGGIAAGEWGLQRGCAVAYTDKGTGNGAHDLGTDTVVLIDGLTAPASQAGQSSHFTADLSPPERMDFNRDHPFRYAFKHAHSRRNPERDWGRFVLRSIEFAFHVLNEQFGREIRGSGSRPGRFSSSNTRVIAFSLSNGGGAVLAAAEQDTEGLIHAVVAGEPQVSLRIPVGLRIERGGRAVASFGRPLFDFLSYANLIQPCAAQAPALADAPLLGLVDQAAATRRARELASAGLLSGATFAEQATDALRRLHEAGWEPESDLLHASHFGAEVTPATAVTYAAAYTLARVSDNLCGFSFATTSRDGRDGIPAAAVPSPLLTLFGTGNGIPPTPPAAGIRLVYHDAPGGPVDHRGAGGDLALEGARRLRALWDGPGDEAERLRWSVDEVRLTGDLRGKPALIVHGRSDALLPVNHTSRPYFGANQVVEGAASRLSYIEVENVQHFDTFLGQLPGFAREWLPLHFYLAQAMGLMWEHLERGTPLPLSQLVRTRPRGQDAPPISAALHLKPITREPTAGDLIRFERDSLKVVIPD
jgi:hydroxybutyrate-dimer hydrolase